VNRLVTGVVVRSPRRELQLGEAVGPTYEELAPTLQASRRNGVRCFNGDRDHVVGRFLAVMWENLADPIITGRGEIGQPKLFADIPEALLIDGTEKGLGSWAARPSG